MGHVLYERVVLVERITIDVCMATRPNQPWSGAAGYWPSMSNRQAIRGGQPAGGWQLAVACLAHPAEGAVGSEPLLPWVCTASQGLGCGGHGGNLRHEAAHNPAHGASSAWLCGMGDYHASGGKRTQVVGCTTDVATVHLGPISGWE
jgi:hypothetical protein